MLSDMPTISQRLRYGVRVKHVGVTASCLVRLTDKDGKDVEVDGEQAMPYYLPDHDSYMLMSDKEEEIKARVDKGEKISAWLVGTACQVVNILGPNDEAHKIRLIGIDPLNSKKCITMSDMLAFYNYM